MNIAVVCNTPYQLMCVVNYTYHLRKTEKVCVDLFLGSNFSGFESVYNRISEMGLFDHIYVFSPRRRGKTILSNADRILNILSPKRCLRSFLQNPDILEEKAYDRIVASVASYFVVALILVFSKAEVVYFDDGVGSYIQELSFSTMSKLTLNIYRLMGRSINRIKPQYILLNCPEMAADSIKEKVRPLPRLDTENSKELQKIFCDIWNYNNHDYYLSKKMICLLSLNDLGRPGMDAFESSAREIIPKQCTNYLMRLHPRQLTSDYQNCVIDERRDMWELVCSDQITDEHVLLSYYSTAQLTPKMLYDKEPVLIFAFRAYPQGLEESRITDIQESIDRLKNSYRAKDRIIIPQTPDELWKCVEEYCK